MTLYTARIRRATIAAVDRLRRDGQPVNRTTVGAEMGVSGPCAAHRLAVLAAIGSILVDPMPRRKPKEPWKPRKLLPRAERARLLATAIAKMRAEEVWL